MADSDSEIASGSFEERQQNLFISCDENFTPSSFIVQPVLTYSKMRGCSDFFFIPGTNDTHVFCLCTEEYEDSITTFVVAFDLEGKTLLPEIELPGERKYEGACCYSARVDAV